MKRISISSVAMYLIFLLYFFLILLLFRVAFWFFISEDLPALFGNDTFKAFYIGCRFDARIAALATLPLGMVLCVPGLAVRLHAVRRWVTFFYGIVFFILISIYAVDFGFYAYLGNRVSRLVFELLLDFRVAVEMVVQSYPVGLIALGIIAGTALCTAGFYGIASIRVRAGSGPGRRIAGFLCGFIIFALAVYGQLDASFYPLRWSSAFFTTNEAVTALGLNPIQSLYDTYGERPSSFSAERAREAYARMADFLQVDNPDMENLNYLRRVKARAEQPLNVVVIILESLAYPKTSFAPGTGDPTPHIRSLAEESLFFRHFFANARTTARAVFTTITGVPDVTQGSTGSRNPLVTDQQVVANEFKGYKKYYMMGGSTGWANIHAVLAQNIEGLVILEEGYWKSPRVDVWGVSDHALLQEAHQVLEGQDPQTPFLAVIQTASFHKPYTVPDTPGFSKEELSETDLKYYGYVDQDEYNSMRYMDFAVGEFMRLAKNSDYYRNTVFLIFGDHGLNDPIINMPVTYEAMNLGPWHVPLLIHASPELRLFAPGVSNKLCSQIDIFPTAAGLAGIAYDNRTLGRDIFDPRFDESRAVFIGGKQDAPIRLLMDDFCFYSNSGGLRTLSRYESDYLFDHTPLDPGLFRKMQQVADDIEVTARYMLFNNKKPSQRARTAQ